MYVCMYVRMCVYIYISMLSCIWMSILITQTDDVILREASEFTLKHLQRILSSITLPYNFWQQDRCSQTVSSAAHHQSDCWMRFRRAANPRNSSFETQQYADSDHFIYSVCVSFQFYNNINHHTADMRCVVSTTTVSWKFGWKTVNLVTVGFSSPTWHRGAELILFFIPIAVGMWFVCIETPMLVFEYSGCL